MNELRGLFNPGEFRDRYQMKRKGLIPPSKWNELMSEISNALASLRVTSFTGGTVSRTMGGQLLSINSGAGGAPGVATKLVPFQILVNKHLSGGVWDNTYDIRLYPGTINQNLPTNIFDLINQAIGSTQYIVLTGSSDGTSVTSSTWSVESTQPIPVLAVADTPPSSFPLLIGVIFWNGATNTFSIYQIVSTNQNALPVIWTQVSRPDAEPFTSPVQNYYTWALMSS